MRLTLNVPDFASYADDNTLCKICENTGAVAKTLRMSAEKQATQISFTRYQVQEIQVKSKFEIHRLKEFSVKNSFVLNFIIISLFIRT